MNSGETESVLIISRISRERKSKQRNSTLLSFTKSQYQPVPRQLTIPTTDNGQSVYRSERQRRATEIATAGTRIRTATEAAIQIHNICTAKVTNLAKGKVRADVGRRMTHLICIGLVQVIQIVAMFIAGLCLHAGGRPFRSWIFLRV